jgi:hypothetical protein
MYHVETRANFGAAPSLDMYPFLRSMIVVRTASDIIVADQV